MFVVLCVILLSPFNSLSQLFPLPNMPANTVYDPNAVAVVRMSGPVDSVDTTNFSFRMNVVQFTSYTQHGVFPTTVILPAESKWQNERKRALPKLPRVVTLTGTLIDLPKLGESGDQTFLISVSRDLEYVGSPDRGAVVPALGMCFS